MKLKRHINFLNESNGEGKTFPVKFMNNEERKILQKMIDILKTEEWEQLPEDLKRTNGDVNDAIANFIYNVAMGGRGEYGKVAKTFYINVEDTVDKLFIKEIFNFSINDWEDGKADSEDLVEETKEELIGYLLDSDDEIMNPNTKEIYLLSEEEEAALPSMKTVDKYDL
jgi:mRNA-degrading endonuclease HigB of HigAB toxin-antitoxin module